MDSQHYAAKAHLLDGWVVCSYTGYVGDSVGSLAASDLKYLGLDCCMTFQITCGETTRTVKRKTHKNALGVVADAIMHSSTQHAVLKGDNTLVSGDTTITLVSAKLPGGQTVCTLAEFVPPSWVHLDGEGSSP